MYPTWVTANTGSLPLKVTSTKLNYNPSAGLLTNIGPLGQITNIQDVSGNKVLEFGYIPGTPTDYISIGNGTASAAAIRVSSSNTNASFSLYSKGAGSIFAGSETTTTSPLILISGIGSQFIFSIPTWTGIRTLTFPDASRDLTVLPALTSTANQVLVSVSNAQSVWTANPTLASLTFSPTTGGIVGTTTNDNAAAGKVGEYIEQVILTGSATAITRNTVTNCFSISLTAGDWDVWGNILFVTVGTTCTNLNSSISTSTGAINDNAYVGSMNLLTGTIGVNTSVVFPQRRISLSTTTTIYGIGILTNVSGNGTYCGYLAARRVR